MVLVVLEQPTKDLLAVPAFLVLKMVAQAEEVLLLLEQI
jgi:hypothetical protein